MYDDLPIQCAYIVDLTLLNVTYISRTFFDCQFNFPTGAKFIITSFSPFPFLHAFVPMLFVTLTNFLPIKINTFRYLRFFSKIFQSLLSHLHLSVVQIWSHVTLLPTRISHGGDRT